MVCLYCAAKTKVVNSRPHDTNYVIWRRRVCTACGAIFTTEEYPQLPTGFVVQYIDKSYAPLRREILFSSIYESCKHREQSAEDADALTKTILARLLRSPNKTPGAIPISEIVATAKQTLKQFDAAAYSYYCAYYAKS